MSFKLKLDWLDGQISFQLTPDLNELPDQPKGDMLPPEPVSAAFDLEVDSKQGKRLTAFLLGLAKRAGDIRPETFSRFVSSRPNSGKRQSPTLDQLQGLLKGLSKKDRDAILLPWLQHDRSKAGRLPGHGHSCQCAPQVAEHKHLLAGFASSIMSLDGQLKQLKNRFGTLEERIQKPEARPPCNSGVEVTQTVKTPTGSKAAGLIERIRSGNWSPLQCASELNKSQNQTIAKSFGMSTAGAELDIVLRFWPELFPNRDLSAALKADFKNMNAQEIAENGTANSSKVLAKALGLDPGGSERARAKHIADALNAEG